MKETIPLAGALAWLAACGAAAQGGEAIAPEEFHLEPRERQAIGEAIDRAAHWLIAHQHADGSFRSGIDHGVPPVPLTAVALWSLSVANRSPNAFGVARSRAASYLLSFQQEDGGIYDPHGGLVRYTAGMALQGLRAWQEVRDDPALRAAIGSLSLFVYRNRELESIRESEVRDAPGATSKNVEELLERADLPQNLGKALEFLRDARRKPAEDSVRWRPLARASAGPAVTYDELLRYIAELARRDNPTVSRAYLAIRASYTLDRNPDLTRRYGPDGFQDEDAGLYYYYLTVARTLGAIGRPELRTNVGKVHDWPRELSERLLSLQREDGSWVNANGRWWEDDPALTTCYAIVGLSHCRDLKRRTE